MHLDVKTACEYVAVGQKVKTVLHILQIVLHSINSSKLFVFPYVIILTLLCI